MNENVRQPRVELPIAIDEIVNVDAVILTHFHPDHFDEFAAKEIDKNIPFFVQHEMDKQIIDKFGFHDVRIIAEDGTDFEGIKLYKTLCQYGRRELVKSLFEQIGVPYEAMGVVFKSDNENTLYIAGDTIWCEDPKQAIDKYPPEIIIINACGATVKVGDGERIIMHVDDIKAISSYAKRSTIIASHMDTVSHLTVTRKDVIALNLDNVVVPNDNEILEFVQ